MKKLFDNIFKSEPKPNYINYKPNLTANGYADDLKIICAHFDELFRGCSAKCEENHPGFYHRRTGKTTGPTPRNLNVQEAMDLLVHTIARMCDILIGGIVNDEAHTIDRTVDMQATRDVVRNMIPSLCDQDLISCNRTGNITIFFAGTYKDTPNVTSGVAIVALKWQLELKDRSMSTAITWGRACAYADLKWIHDHLERAKKLENV
jgi:hypothetical protein